MDELGALGATRIGRGTSVFFGVEWSASLLGHLVMMVVH
jgi:hypothetical protein